MMLASLILLAAAAAAQQPMQSRPVAASATTAVASGAAALALFQDDAALHYWALKHYDSDGDIALSEGEAAAAAAGFKTVADANRDGRVTTYEFDRAREFIVARF